jgi:ABC-type Mn2+/Zn2+ transport system ATPase subunit
MNLRLLYSPHRHAEPIAGAPALVFEHVYVLHQRDHAVALADLSFTIPAGKRIALIGSNGAGKSSLLKTVVGLMPLSQGDVRIYGHPIGTCRHRVAYLPQRGEIDWQFPVDLRTLVLSGRYVHLGWLRRPSATDFAIVDRVIHRLGLQDLANRQIGQLSGGQQQRALFARAIAQEADLLLLDEPFNAVDAETRTIIGQVLDRLHAEGKTVLAATHDTNHLKQMYDGLVELENGTIVDTKLTEGE